MLNASENLANPKRRSFAILALIVVFSFGASLAGDFVWIDKAEILAGGYRLVSPSEFGALWTQSLDEFVQSNDNIAATQGGYWRPLYALSLTADWAIWQDTAWLYHAENLVWHYLVVVGLFLIGLRLMADTGFERPERVAFWAAALFAAHPLGVHSVTWISGRKDLMCAAFACFCLLAFDRACQAPDRRKRLLWTVGSVTCLLAATLCKELALVTPLAAAIFLVVHHRRPIVTSLMTKLWIYASLWLVVGMVGIYRWVVLGGFGLNAQPASESILTNAGVSSGLMWHYLGRVVYPISPSISDSWTVSALMGWSDWISLLAMLVLLGVTGFLFYRHRQYSIGLIWFAIWMLPASGLVPLRHLRAERYLYPASWGLCFLFALLILSWGSSRYRSLLLGLIVLFLMGVSAWECRYWFSDRVLFEHSVQQDPAHLEGRLGIANNHLNRGLERGQTAKGNGEWQFSQADARLALEQVQSVLEQSRNPELRSYWPAFETYTYQGLAYFYLGDLENANTAFETALTYRSNSGVAKYHLGLIALSRSKYPTAIEKFQSALRVQPGDFLTRSNLAVSYLRNNQLDDATILLKQLVDERPVNQLNRLNYGNCLLAKQQFKKAKPHFAWLVEQDGDNPIVQAKLAWCEYMAGSKTDAFVRLEKVRRTYPNEPTVLSILSHLRNQERELNRRANQ